MSSFIERPRYSCALGGALATLRAIDRAVPVIHAASGCGYNLYNATNTGAAYLGGGYCGATSIPSSNVTEKEIVFGGEKRLAEEIRTSLEVMDGDLFVVVSGCMVEMIGDDIERVVKDLGETEKPVIAVQTPSFRGNSYFGYDLVLEGIVNQYVETPEKTIPKTVNVFGLVPGEDIFYKGNLREIKRVLSLIGVRANTLFGEGETLDDIRKSGSASLNIVLSHVYGVKTAQAYQKRFGIPFVQKQLPIGFLQTAQFLYEIAETLGIPKQTVTRAINQERHVYYDYLERATDIYTDADLQKYAVVVSDANYAPSVTRFLSDELGWIPKLTVITDPVNKNQKAVLEQQFEDFESGLRVNVEFDVHTASVKKYLLKAWPPNRNQKYYDAFSPAVVIGSVFDNQFAAQINAPILTISYPVTNRVIFNRAYAGFHGGLTFAEDVFAIVVAGR